MPLPGLYAYPDQLRLVCCAAPVGRTTRRAARRHRPVRDRPTRMVRVSTCRLYPSRLVGLSSALGQRIAASVVGACAHERPVASTVDGSPQTAVVGGPADSGVEDLNGVAATAIVGEKDGPVGAAVFGARHEAELLS